MGSVNLSIFRLVALMLGSQWNGCITVKKCNPFTVMPSQYWDVHNICDIIYIISHHLLSETVLSQLCSFTRNSFLFYYIYKTVMHLFYFYTIKRVCACASVRFQSSELSRTHEGRKLSGLSRNSVMWHKAPGNVNLPSGAQNSRRHLWSELNEVTFALLYKTKLDSSSLTVWNTSSSDFFFLFAFIWSDNYMFLFYCLLYV